MYGLSTESRTITRRICSGNSKYSSLSDFFFIKMVEFSIFFVLLGRNNLKQEQLILV